VEGNALLAGISTDVLIDDKLNLDTVSTER
jgi:hypothetical protein